LKSRAALEENMIEERKTILEETPKLIGWEIYFKTLLLTKQNTNDSIFFKDKFTSIKYNDILRNEIKK
jgi:hypothetical protein